MDRSVLAHPLVENYLRVFDVEAAVLPVERARELHEQLAAHIDDAAGPDAGDEEIAAILRGLGSARVLVAEAAAATGKRSLRVGWKGWTLVGVLVLIAAAVSGYFIRVSSVGPLFVEGLSAWWYPQDYKHQVQTSADGATQTTVPIRAGHRQGFVIQVFNFTAMTQTVVGSNLDWGPSGGTDVRVSLSTRDPNLGGPDGVPQPQAMRYTLPPVSIPPGQSRYLRITWISHGCLPKGDGLGMDFVELRVRVGWTNRTEDIPFNEGFYLGHASGYCPS